MGRSLICLGVLLAGALVAARAQPVAVPAPPSYPVTLPASDNPLQQQILRNYRSVLQQTARELTTRDPFALSREQLDVMHQLNAVNSALTPAPALPVAPPTAVPATPAPAPFR